jgi:hypothetical protein
VNTPIKILIVEDENDNRSQKINAVKQPGL